MKNNDKTICAGILSYKKENNVIKFLLVHAGGPYWKNKNEFSWQIPKGHQEINETIKDTAIREFEEETGIKIIDKSKVIKLGNLIINTKNIYIFTYMANDFDNFISSNFCDIEFPPNSGKIISIPENNDGKWFTKEECKIYMNRNQHQFIDLFFNTYKE